MKIDFTAEPAVSMETAIGKLTLTYDYRFTHQFLNQIGLAKEFPN
jgi:hypothetical protein